MDEQRATRVIGILTPRGAGEDVAELIREGLSLHRDGADIVDFDTLPSGAFADSDLSTLALVFRGLSEAGVTVSVTTTRADVARLAVDRGARWIFDPSGTTADPEMIEVARRPSFVGWGIGPWSPRAAHEGGAIADADADRYMYGLVRNLAPLLEAGVRSERIVLNASAGLSPDASDPWLMLGQLERVRALGYPVLVDARDEVLASMSTDGSPEQLVDTAVGLAVLAVGAHAWGIRAKAIDRVADTVGRVIERRQSA